MKDFFIGVFSKIKAVHVAFFVLLLLAALFGVYMSLSTNPANRKVTLPAFHADTTIVPAKGAYAYENKTNGFRSQFKEKPTASNSIVFSNNLGNISFFTPAKQSFGTINSDHPPITDGSIITYPDIFPSVDIKYTISSTRLLEEFIIKDAATATSIDRIEQIATTKSTYVENDDGSITFSNKDRVAFTLPHPVMYEIGNQESRSDGIVYEIKKDGNQLIITKIITEAGKTWLADKSRQYPIAIDIVIDNADALSSATVIDNADVITAVNTIIDNANTSSNWTSSDGTKSTVSQETTIKQEGSGSVKTQTTAGGASTNVDLMEYSSDGTAQTAYVTNGGPFSATGGTITTSGGYTIHTFTSSGTFTPTGSGNVEVLVVAGGGSGGSGGNSGWSDGGGGAGGLRTNSAYAVSGAITVTVGAGGASVTANADTGVAGNPGGASAFGTLSTVGGGRGGQGGAGGTGGSGGGGGLYSGGGGSGTSGEGNNGGIAGPGGNNFTGGGGGGAGGVGGDGVGSGGSGTGGTGGAGTNSSISGSSVCYAGGGGGAGYGAGGTATCGGGAGAVRNTAATNGTANRGGGGGGTSGAASGAGGSGIVIVRYPTGTTLQSYTEATIKTQGTYAVKGVAAITTSLNKTLTRTIASPLNLSDNSNITFDIRSSRTGSNIKVGLHDSGGTTTEVTPNITQADTFQSATIDLSGVTNANKDAIDKIIITIVNADAANTFYLDNMVSTASSSVNNTITRTVSATDLSSIANITYWVRSSVAGSYATFGFGESAATEQTNAITISQANTWEQKTWDISGITGTSRDAVTKYAFKFTSNTSGAAFYFDDIQATYPANWVSSDATNTTLSQETTIKQEGTGSIKTQTTAGAGSTTVDLFEFATNQAAIAPVIVNGITATGGTITYSGDYTIHTFTSSGTFTPSGSGTVEYLVVGGGGGGGGGADSNWGAGGGGAGGYRTATGYAVTAGSGITVTIGAGGTGGAAANNGTVGGDSVFGTITSTGGGFGTGSGAAPLSNGGSGGGGRYGNTTGGTGNTPSTSPSQGNNGGRGNNGGPYGGGGGGGASAAGGGAINAYNAGGAGTASSISGASVTYAGGGGAGGNGGNGAGGAGGGGAGGVPGVAGTANTGGGGGGGSFTNTAGGNGGSGIVIVRYLTADFPSSGYVTNGNEFSATGGTITTSGGYTIHKFTSNGTFTPNIAGNVEYLVVGGGGGGGADDGGGGGGGGFRTSTGFAVTAQEYPIIVGTGGVASAQGSPGGDGGDSIFSSITSIGGGGGARRSAVAGRTGGSGGGGTGGYPTAGGAGTAGQGYAGGNGNVTSPYYPSGGGGGASAVGVNGVAPNVAGNGGAGTANSISGASVTYAGGGGGSVRGGTGGTGGSGGGGAGAGSSGVNGVAGTANTGGGGGGATYSAGTGGAGGSGIVIIRYPTTTGTSLQAYNGMNPGTGGTIRTSGSYAIHTFTSSGTFTPVESGNVEVLVVAGGGGGGSEMGGGGGGGGVIYNSAYAVTPGAITATVGNGGAGAPAGIGQVRGTNGQNSVFGTITATGGGGGASSYENNSSPAGNGGSGGGTAGCNSVTFGTGIAGQGFAGGGSGGCYYPGGGGGASGAGSTNPAHGGVGVANSILGTLYYWSGGGGGAGYSGIAGNGGLGGGGGGSGGGGSNSSAGGQALNPGVNGQASCGGCWAQVPGGNGGPNTGGGGGGGSHYNLNNYGGDGGSGVVIVKYIPSQIKSEGSYSLKGVATITTSLNKTMTRTIASPLNLSDKASVTFDIRASRTGSNIKVGIHDAGGTTTEVTPNIASANTFQSATIDLSGVTNANKDAIDQIIITIVNADATNTFYLDNMVAAAASSINDTITRTVSATDLSAATSLTYWVRSSVAGSYATFGFGETAATEQTQAITINSPNTWEQKIWDISGITGTSRDAVTKFAFTFTGDTSGASFYFDDIQSVISPTWVSSDATNTAVSVETTIKQEGSGSVKVQTTAGTSYTGTGADGAITVSADTSINTTNKISARSCADGGDAVNYSVSSLTSTTATLESTPSSGCLTAGDEVLLINLRGTASAFSNTGNYETLTISSISTNVITFTTAKTKYYGAGASDDTNIGLASTNQVVMLQRVPNYTNVTISTAGTDFYPDEYVKPTGSANNGGGEGGVMFFRANGTVSIAASTTINANGRGYIGGTAAASYQNSSSGGESFCTNGGGNGAGYNSGGGNATCGGGGGAGAYELNGPYAGGTGSASYGGAGGGGGSAYGTGVGYAGGGGGGGYGALGLGGAGGVGGSNGGTNSSGNGGANTSWNNAGSYWSFGGGGGGGGTYGVVDLSKLFFGSAAGGGGGGYYFAGGAGGDGADGGGVIYIGGATLSISGNIQSNGGTGVAATSGCCGGGGGGGAGGSIILNGDSLTLGSSLVTATGGNGGIGAGGGSPYTGRAGGVGRIAVTAESVSGTTSPTYNANAVPSSSTNDTVTRTTAATDLSGVANLTYWVRSSVAGSYATFGFGESAATEQTNAITINQANTWEQKIWNIEGITGTARNAVTKYAFTFTGNPSGAAFYFDDIQTNALFAPTLGTATSLTGTSIRWNLTDNSTEETGFKIYDSSSNLLVTCATANLTYCDETGLTPNTQYTRKIGAYNASSASIASGTVSGYTLAAVPGTPTVTNRTNTTIQINPNPSTNSASTAMAIYAEAGTTCDGSNGLGYVQANGSISTSAVWQTDAAWGTAGVVTVTGLNAQNVYSFCVKAKNANDVPTAFSSSGLDNSGYIPISGSYVFTGGTSLNSSNIITRYQNRTNGGRYIFGVDNGTQDSDPNTAIFEVQTGILVIHNLDSLVAGSLRLTGGSIQIATTGAEIKIGEKLWAIDADVDGYTSDGKLSLGSTKPAGGRRKGLVTTFDTLDCGDSTYSTSNVCMMTGTGGTVTTIGNYKIHTFTSSGTFVLSYPGNAEVLVVGGGGGAHGGYNGSAGGGGGGGYQYSASLALTVGSYPVTVGAGGPASGGNGGSSIFSTITAVGGGGGGGNYQATGGGGGGSGGSGGGGAPGINNTVGGGSGSQGASGGSGTTNGADGWSGGGGGGAQTAGGNASTYQAGAGGSGYANSISGTSVGYAGGGGGSSTSSGGAGGAGGGGNGESMGAGGSAGTANTGGGAGGNQGTFYAGGSGIVIIKYQFQ